MCVCVHRLINYLRVENFLVLAMAFVINLFVICVFADGFYGVLTEDEVGMCLMCVCVCMPREGRGHRGYVSWPCMFGV